jgi:hypothetical protein
MLTNVKLYSAGLQLSAEGIKLLSNAGILPRYGEKKVGQDPEPCMAIYIKDSNLVRVFNL